VETEVGVERALRVAAVPEVAEWVLRASMEGPVELDEAMQVTAQPTQAEMKKGMLGIELAGETPLGRSSQDQQCRFFLPDWLATC